MVRLYDCMIVVLGRKFFYYTIGTVGSVEVRRIVPGGIRIHGTAAAS